MSTEPGGGVGRGPSLEEAAAWWKVRAGEVGEDDAWDDLKEQWGAERLTELAHAELAKLGSADFRFLGGLLGALGDRRLLKDLVEVLRRAQGLSLESTWHAMEALEGSGLIEGDEELSERREEMIEALDGDDATVDALVDHLEENPGEVWVALQGLEAVEPEVRAEILEDLGEISPLGHGLAEFLRLLAHAEDSVTRHAALDALARWRPTEDEDPERYRAWRELAAFPHDGEVAEKAARVLAAEAEGGAVAWEDPVVVSGLVTGVDGEGKAQVALISRRGGEWSAAVFGCDVMAGVVDVVGHVGATVGEVDALLDELRESADRDFIEGVAELAAGLLGGSMALGRPESPAFRFWVERSVGPAFGPRPFAGLEGVEEGDPEAVPHEEMRRRAAAVLDACPPWVDRSPMTFEMAEELLLRNGGAEPDPVRDAGAYRFLFERRLGDRLELYRRMLAWMGWFWRAAGAGDLADSALALAYQLGDPQHVVPGHPFMSELMTRSLAAAQEAIRERMGSTGED